MAFYKPCRLHESQDVWRPNTSQVELGRYEVNKVNVAFDNRENHSSKGEDVVISRDPEDCVAKTEHVHVSPDRLGNVNYDLCMAPCSTCADEDVHSIKWRCETSPGVSTARSNILSQMAKTKTSWVEDQNSKLSSGTSRRSPILCKGKPLGKSSCTPYQESQIYYDNSTKGVRDGRRFDLLPISKKFSQNLKERQAFQEKRSPLVRICSYQKMCMQLPCYSLRPDGISRSSRAATFFTKKDVFQPFQARTAPTRGEKLLVRDSSSLYPSNRKLSLQRLSSQAPLLDAISEAAKLKLPSLRKMPQGGTLYSHWRDSEYRHVYEAHVPFPVIA